jgi:hypothetical protein
MKIFKRNYLTEDNTKYLSSWIKFHKMFNISLYVSKAGYFDERPQLYTSITQLLFIIAIPVLTFYSPFFLFLIPFIFFGWGKLYISLPIKTGIEDSDSAAWGFNYHNDTVWIYIGGAGNFEGGKKWITYEMPWTLKWYRTSILLKDNTWIDEFKNKKMEFYEDKWDSEKLTYICDYIDNYDNEVVTCKIQFKEMEWRRKVLMFLPIFRKIYRYIDVHFDKEVGSRKGTWKGGTLGTSLIIDKNEKIIDAMKRLGFNCKSLIREQKIDEILN